MPLGPYPPPDKRRAPAPVATDADSAAKWSGTLPDKTVATLVELVSETNLAASVASLAAFHTRHSYSTTIASAAAWLVQQFEARGFTVNLHDFTANGHALQNVVATRAGTSGRTFMVCGHYDCRMQDADDATSRAPGANDNGSGVAILLELASILRQVELVHEVRLVAFAGEEQGLLGSTAYAELVSSQGLDIGWLLNLDMVGRPDPQDNIVIERDMGNAQTANNAPSQAWGDTIAGLTSAYTSLSVKLGQIFASDYMPFEEAGYVVAGLWQSGSHLSYHTDADLPTVVDTAYHRQVARLALATVLTEVVPYRDEASGSVDVYIRDSAADTGEHPSPVPHWTSPDIWVRNNAPPADPNDPNDPNAGEDYLDGHQAPIVGVPNYMYVRVHNKGSQAAAGFSVDAYHCNPGTGMAWPGHFTLMGTLAIPGDVPANGGSDVVGPFIWTPEIEDHECLLAIARGPDDHAVADVYSGALNHSLLVRFDNNVGQRNVSPKGSVPGGKTKTTFFMRGKSSGTSTNDLQIDTRALPIDSHIEVKILRRITDGATIQNLTVVGQSTLWTTLELAGGVEAVISGFELKPNDRVGVTLDIDFSMNAQHGQIYPIIATQVLDGMVAGRMTIEITAIKESEDYVYGNPRSMELHVVSCPFWPRINQHNKRPFMTIQDALARGYNGCAFCLREWDTG